MSSATDQHVIDRQERLRNAWNSMKVEELMDCMVDEGLFYSDYGTVITTSPNTPRATVIDADTAFTALLQFGMDKQAMTEVFTHVFEVTEDLVFKTESVHGTRECSVWEYSMQVTHTKESPVMGPPKGPLKLRGCAVSWWNEEDKLVKCHDYSIWLDEEKAPK